MFSFCLTWNRKNTVTTVYHGYKLLLHFHFSLRFKVLLCAVSPLGVHLLCGGVCVFRICMLWSSAWRGDNVANRKENGMNYFLLTGIQMLFHLCFYSVAEVRSELARERKLFKKKYTHTHKKSGGRYSWEEEKQTDKWGLTLITVTAAL